MPTGSNPYSSALGLEDLDLPAFIATGAPNGRTAILAALVEHGAPLSLEAIARRVHALGMGASEEKLLRSLRKAWGASSALRKLEDGTLSLDVGAADADFLKVQVELAMRAAVPAPTPPAGRPDTEPLSEQELRECLPGAWLLGFTKAKIAAMVTEAFGRPMSPEEINTFVSGFTARFLPIGNPKVGVARSSLVNLDEEGRLQVANGAKGLPALRRQVRALGAREKRAREIESEIEAASEGREAARKRMRADAKALRRCLLHVYAIGDRVVAVGHMDPVEGRGVQIVKSPSPADASWLPGSDVLIGLDIRKVLARLGIDPGSRRLVDLGPPQKTKSLGRGRPVLKLTTEHLLRHTLGGWARLASKTKIRALARPGADDDLHGAMEADLDTLATYYWYGVRNRFLSAGWQDFDMLVEAPFREPGDEPIGTILERLLGKEVWLRLRGNRISDPPEDMTGLLTHIAWGGFTLHARDFKLQGPMSAVLAVEEVPGLRLLED